MKASTCTRYQNCDFQFPSTPCSNTLVHHCFSCPSRCPSELHLYKVERAVLQTALSLFRSLIYEHFIFLWCMVWYWTGEDLHKRFDLCTSCTMMSTIWSIKLVPDLRSGTCNVNRLPNFSRVIQMAPRLYLPHRAVHYHTATPHTYPRKHATQSHVSGLV